MFHKNRETIVIFLAEKSFLDKYILKYGCFTA